MVWVQGYSSGTKSRAKRVAERLETDDPAQLDEPGRQMIERIARLEGDRYALAAEWRGRYVEYEPDFSMVTAPVLILTGERDTAAGNFTLKAQVLHSSVPPMVDSQTYTLCVGTTVPPTTSTTTTTTTTTTSTPAFGGGGGGFPAPAPTTTTPPVSAPGTTTTTAPPRHPSLPHGTPSGVYSAPVNATVVAGTTTHLAYQLRISSGVISVPPGALPTGTVVSIYPAKDPAALMSKLPAGQSYLISFAVSWVAPNGTSPTAKPPLTMTVTDPSIKAGDTIYALTSSGLKAVGVATKNGMATVSFTGDPDFVVANVPQLASVPATAGLKGSNIQVKINCSSAVKYAGSGILSVAAKKTGGVAHATELAHGNFVLGAGQTTVVSFATTPSGREFLAAAGGHSFAASLSILLTGGKLTVYRLAVP